VAWRLSEISSARLTVSLKRMTLRPAESAARPTAASAGTEIGPGSGIRRMAPAVVRGRGRSAWPRAAARAGAAAAARRPSRPVGFPHHDHRSLAWRCGPPRSQVAWASRPRFAGVLHDRRCPRTPGRRGARGPGQRHRVGRRRASPGVAWAMDQAASASQARRAASVPAPDAARPARGPPAASADSRLDRAREHRQDRLESPAKREGRTRGRSRAAAAAARRPLGRARARERTRDRVQHREP
jgi:hypothetical protein